MNPFLTENPPDDVVRHSHCLCRASPVPSGETLGKRLFKRCQDSGPELRSIGGRFPGTFQSPESLGPLFGESLSPQPDSSWATLRSVFRQGTTERSWRIPQDAPLRFDCGPSGEAPCVPLEDRSAPVQCAPSICRPGFRLYPKRHPKEYR